GTDYTPARLYHRETGRFTTRDPHPTPLNKYQAFNANPAEYTDPSGNISFRFGKRNRWALPSGKSHVSQAQMARMYEDSGRNRDGTLPAQRVDETITPAKPEPVLDKTHPQSAANDVTEIFGNLLHVERGAETIAARHLAALSKAPLKDLEALLDSMQTYRLLGKKAGIFITSGTASSWSHVRRALTLADDPDPETSYRSPNVESALHEAGHAMASVRGWLTYQDPAATSLVARVRTAYMEDWANTYSKTIPDVDAISYLKDDDELLAEIYWFRYSPSSPLLFAGSEKAADIIRNDTSLF
uniref:hypothetical protein n=1 Tax=Streptomyces sp. NRRL F-2664 TaxID=1463842 RepID=UPI00131C713B